MKERELNKTIVSIFHRRAPILIQDIENIPGFVTYPFFDNTLDPTAKTAKKLITSNTISKENDMITSKVNLWERFKDVAKEMRMLMVAWNVVAKGDGFIVRLR